MAGGILRRCASCGADKPMSEFFPNPHKNFKCAPCLKAYKRERYLRQRDTIVARTRQRYWADPEASRAASRARAKADPKSRSRKDAYKVRHKQRVNDQARAYRSRNALAVSARIADWRGRNRPLLTLYAANRRAAQIRATPEWANPEAMLAIYSLASRMCLAGLAREVDHIVPLQGRNVCGLHCEWNLQVLPRADNRSKANRHWPDMWDVSAL